MTSTAESSPWTGDRLRSLLFSWWLWDGDPRRVAELLNDDENLPPLNDDTLLVSVDGEALSDWKDEVRPGYRRYADHLLREGRGEVQKEKWEADLEELEGLGQAVEEAERDTDEEIKNCREWIGRQITEGTLHGGVEELPAEAESLDLNTPKWLFPKGALLTELMRARKLKADWAELYRLQRRLMRVECQHEFRLEVLGEALKRFRNTGPARSPEATEARSEHERKVLEYFDEVPELTGTEAPGYVREAYAALNDASIGSGRQLAGRIGDRRTGGNTKVKTIKRGTGYLNLPTKKKREGGWLLLKALIKVHGGRLEGETAEEPPQNRRTIA